MSDHPDNVQVRQDDTVRFVPLGDSAITVEFGCTIDPWINGRVVAFADAVVAQDWPGILDVVPTFRSATVHFDPLRWDSAEMIARLRAVTQPTPSKTVSQGRLHEIPVLYGGEWGPDLQDLATFAGLKPADVIALHASVRYRVYMLGFSPGFPYLGLVPERLAIPRMATPRTKVPAGSVGIADRQTGIYPTATPGGWRLIGRTPLSLYRRTSPHPFLLKTGDLVRFKPIEREEFDGLSCEEPRENH
ncbi:MAG: 5-oxoprolinase subunit PxpB [Nitrospira sp.]|nr:5-oxoprolinase subunit PxpB [Nitrospira sp.]